jgi:hypothetical protein
MLIYNFVDEHFRRQNLGHHSFSEIWHVASLEHNSSAPARYLGKLAGIDTAVRAVSLLIKILIVPSQKEKRD